jgi:hypothetical protein
MKETIRVRMRIEENDIRRYGQDKAFVRALTDWEELSWVQFLKEHSEIVHVENYKHYETMSTIYIVHWQLPSEQATMFYLKYSEEIQG